MSVACLDDESSKPSIFQYLQTLNQQLTSALIIKGGGGGGG